MDIDTSLEYNSKPVKEESIKENGDHSKSLAVFILFIFIFSYFTIFTARFIIRSAYIKTPLRLHGIRQLLMKTL